MVDDVKMRFKVNSQALSKAAMVLSNSVVLAANIYLVGSNVHQSITSRRQSRISDSLQTAVDVAQSFGSLTKLITDIVEKNHVKNSSDL